MAEIHIHNLHKYFKKNHVLKGIDLKIDAGGIYSILGPNASGKTTLIKTILGMVLPDAGQIKINGENIFNQWIYKKLINYLPQLANFPDNLTINELFNMIQELRGKKGNIKLLIDEFDISPHLETKLSNLSGGTKQKVNLVLALMYDNPIYILDEPTAGLDPVALITLKKKLFQLKASGRLVIITTHIISLVEQMSDEIIFLLEGEVRFFGKVKKLNRKYKSKSLENSIALLLQDNNYKS